MHSMVELHASANVDAKTCRRVGSFL